MDLGALYPWIVFIHVAAAFGFAISHGVSVFASFRVRREREPERIRALLDLSLTGISFVYLSLLVLLIAGIAAGILGGHFGRLWIWVSLALLIGMIVTMYALASRYYAQVRHAVGLVSPFDKKGTPPPEPVSAPELDRLLDSSRPFAIAIVGLGGLLLILWLMLFKPF